MKTISIIGGGNVAFHLTNHILKNANLKINQIYNRSDFSHHFDIFSVEKITDLTQLKPNSDLYLICVNDENIETVSNILPIENQLVVHTSGNTSIEKINPKNRRGVLYPVQSFSKEKEVDFTKIPFCIEAENEKDFQFLTEIAHFFSEKTYKMDSIQRKFLHISAVFLNNFSNHIWYLSEKLCNENYIPFEILQPLLNETYQKTEKMSFFQAQTGPAKRKDFKTIQAHLSLLKNDEKEIYKSVTNSILNTYE